MRGRICHVTPTVSSGAIPTPLLLLLLCYCCKAVLSLRPILLVSIHPVRSARPQIQHIFVNTIGVVLGMAHPGARREHEHIAYNQDFLYPALPPPPLLSVCLLCIFAYRLAASEPSPPFPLSFVIFIAKKAAPRSDRRDRSTLPAVRVQP